jgi:UDP-glucuronate 4-epimerase
MAALERPMGYAIINLGFGSPIPLTDFIQIYEALIGKPAITRPVPAPATEPLITYCDNTRARELLGFSPKVAIADGLANTWDWYRSYYGL